MKITAPSCSGSLGKALAGHAVTPGPGHYSSPNLNHWFKKSYNQNFNEV